MAGKLQKLKDKLKRWHSFQYCLPAAASSNGAWLRRSSSMYSDKHGTVGLHQVYVGKSRRRYLVSSDVIDHPLFQVLARRSRDWDGGCGNGNGGATVVGCEVVLFEHLLWMFENADLQPDSIDELVEYYTC